MRISLSTTEDYNNRLDNIAIQFGWTRSEAFRRMIELFEEEKLEKMENRDN